MVPTGGYVSAGIGQDMRGYSFGDDAAAVSGSILAGFSGLPGQAGSIGRSFAAGLASGIRSGHSGVISAAVSAAQAAAQAARAAEAALYPEIPRRNAAPVVNQSTDSRDMRVTNEIQVEKMEVRSERDLYDLSRELYALVKRDQRLIGAR